MKKITYLLIKKCRKQSTIERKREEFQKEVPEAGYYEITPTFVNNKEVDA